MIQNLSERERKVRLLLGLMLIAGSVITYITNYWISFSSTFAIAGAALLINYFTCFCGAKKAENMVRSKLPI